MFEDFSVISPKFNRLGNELASKDSLHFKSLCSPWGVLKRATSRYQSRAIWWVIQGRGAGIATTLKDLQTNNLAAVQEIQTLNSYQHMHVHLGPQR